MLTIKGKSKKPCVFCGTKENTVLVAFKDGRFAGVTCFPHLNERLEFVPERGNAKPLQKPAEPGR